MILTPANQLILACATLALLTGLVMIRLLLVRVSEMKTLGLDMQDVSNSLQVQSQLRGVQASDNYKNLFEMPVLFYALCAVLLASGLVTPDWVWAAWAYVGLRVLHSLIQCSYNQVLHRFIVFFVSSVLLLGMWGQLGWQMLQTSH